MNKKNIWRMTGILALFCLGVLALAALDMHQAVAAPEAWMQGAIIPTATGAYQFAQCSDDPNGYYILGGGEPPTNQFWHYDVSSYTWEQLPPMPQPIRIGGAICYQGKIYLAGGFTGTTHLDTLYIYDILSGEWTEGANMPHHNIGFAIGAWDNKLYLVGGSLVNYPWPPMDHVDIYEIASDTWIDQGGSSLPIASVGAGYVQRNSFLYLIGGWSGTINNLTTSLRYDMAAGTWQSGPPFTSARAFFALATTESHLYAIGGDETGVSFMDTTDLVEALDLTAWPGGSWTDIVDPLPQEVVFNNAGFCTEALSGGEIWSVGGIDAQFQMVDENYYRPTAPCYTPPYGLSLEPPEDAKAGNPSGTITYTLSLTNLGSNTDSYDISITSVWTTTAPAVIGPLAPDESTTFDVIVEVPPDSQVGDQDTAQVAATSQGQPAVSDYSLLTSRATEWYVGFTMPGGWAGNITYCPEQPNSFYLVAGIGPGDIDVRTLNRYDIDTGTWTQLADMPMPRRALAVACYQGKIYAGGGFHIFGPLNQFYIYDIASDTWTSGVDFPTAVWGATFGAWDGKLYLVGGSYIGYPYTPTGRVDVYDIASDSWEIGGGASMPTPASFFGSIQRGYYLYAVGGSSGDFNNNVNQTQIFNMATGQWDTGPTFTSARALTSLAMTESHLYALGGDTNGGDAFDMTDLVEVLDISAGASGEWTDFGDNLPESNIYPASHCSEVMVGGEIWAVGGVDQNLEPYELGNYHATEPCISYGVNLPDEPLLGSGEPGTTVEYLLTITNTGVVTDYYTISVSTTWGSLTILGGPGGPVPPGGSIQIIVAIPIPSDLWPGDQGESVVTVTSMSNYTMFDTAIFTTSVTNFTTHMPFVWKS